MRLRHNKTVRIAVLATALLCMRLSPGVAKTPDRFFLMGSGLIQVRSTKVKWRFSGRYRSQRGHYKQTAIRAIHRVFGAPYRRGQATLSLRFIEALAFLRDQLKGGWITISSGYRSPAYNRRLRRRGKTVAKASLHLYGMAADLRLDGVPAKDLWTAARKHRVGGAGYYGSPWVHVDVGPPRHWTQSTANVRKGRSNANKSIILVPQYDRYRGGDTMRLQFVRMTALPLGVRRSAELQRQDTTEQWHSIAKLALWKTPASPTCRLFRTVQALRRLRLSIPSSLPSGRYRLRSRFCGQSWPEMPPHKDSYVFELAHHASSHSGFPARRTRPFHAKWMGGHSLRMTILDLSNRAKMISLEPVDVFP